MSWWISLDYADIRECLVPNHTEGGTYCLGNTNGEVGTQEASLNVTYNYSPFYYQLINTEEGIRWLSGKTANETIPILENAVSVLGCEKTEDYWDANEGNAGYALSILLSWAKLHPDAIWSVN